MLLKTKDRIVSYTEELWQLINPTSNSEDKVPQLIKEVKTKGLPVNKLKSNQFVQIESTKTEYVGFCLQDSGNLKYYYVISTAGNGILKKFFLDKGFQKVDQKTLI